MNNVERLHQVMAAEQTVTRLYYALDRSDYPGASRCFVPDGIWERSGSALHGHEQILASLNKRPATLLTRHYVSNFLVLEQSGSSAKVAFNLAVYRSDKGEAPALPVAGTVPAMLAEVECELTCSEQGDWLIQRLDPLITFTA